MNHLPGQSPNPQLDLVFERIIDVPRELVWRAWTTPEMITQWFTPAPWKTLECEIDLRPGGHLPNGDALAGRAVFSACRLLSRNHCERKTGVDQCPWAGLSACGFCSESLHHGEHLAAAA